MDALEWHKQTKHLERSIASLRGHMRSGRNDLAAKIKYQARMKEQQEVLRHHRLNYHSLVSE